MALLQTLLAFIAAIGVLVVVHEFGHYWVANKLGIKVLRFSIGFGKPLAMWRRGPDRTEWAIAALPFGGFVRMLDEREAPVEEHEKHRAFNRQPLLARSAVVVAGPAANFLFAILAYGVLFAAGIEGLRPVVGRVEPESIAARAGFVEGDELMSMDGLSVQSWDQRRLYLFARAVDKATVDVTVRDRDGIERRRELDLSSVSTSRLSAGLLESEIGLYGYMPPLEAVIGAIEPDSPAAEAKLAEGDRIVAINGASVAQWEDVRSKISANPGARLNLRVQRGAEELDVPVVPARVESGGESIGRIGVAPKPTPIPEEMKVTVRQGPVEAVAEGARQTWLMSWLTLRMLGKMFTLEVSTKTLSGPITIAQYAGQSASLGLDRFLMFLAVVSVSLGVLNLLPIPVLDGGHLLYFVIEAVKGSAISERAAMIGQQTGIAMLLALMTLAIYNDVMRLIF